MQIQVAELFGEVEPEMHTTQVAALYVLTLQGHVLSAYQVARISVHVHVADPADDVELFIQEVHIPFPKKPALHVQVLFDVCQLAFESLQEQVLLELYHFALGSVHMQFDWPNVEPEPVPQLSHLPD